VAEPSPFELSQCRLLCLHGIEDALHRIRPFLSETPLVRSELLSRLFVADVWTKNETVSPIACFKLRGALTDLLRAQTCGSISAAVTSSTGNHGQGVAYAARLLGIPAHIFLPVGANPTKRLTIQALGGTVHEAGNDIDAAKAMARAFTATHGYCFADDGESLGVMEGAGTVGLEVAQTLKAIDWLTCPWAVGRSQAAVERHSRHSSQRPASWQCRLKGRQRWSKASLRGGQSPGRCKQWPTGWYAASQRPVRWPRCGSSSMMPCL